MVNFGPWFSIQNKPMHENSDLTTNTSWADPDTTQGALSASFINADLPLES